MTHAMTTPRRIQRKRTSGWRMPPNAKYVGRPSKWGNPYLPGKRCMDPRTREVVTVRDKAHAVELYRAWWEAAIAAVDMDPHEVFEPLRGKNLVCWCPLDQPCHADVLLDLANPED